MRFRSTNVIIRPGWVVRPSSVTGNYFAQILCGIGTSHHDEHPLYRRKENNFLP